LRVIALNGMPAGAGTMWLRDGLIKIVVWGLSGGIALISYIWALFDKDRQAIHDKMFSTYVVRHEGAVESMTPVAVAAG
jgi:uncharacterized RDD family membrane protein YckC